MLSLRAELANSFSSFDFATRSAVLVAVSGGSDSTALLLLLKAWLAEYASRTHLVAATVDHGLRQGSAEEAASVARLAARIGIAHLTLVWQGEKPVVGIQAAAREARYGLLAQAASRIGTDIIATGHTADDQAETVLMRKARGEGLGLSGMAPVTLLAGRPWIVRPLLGERREALRADLRAAGIGWLDDPTNINSGFERARRRAGMREADLTAALETSARTARDRQALARAAADLIRGCAAMPAPGLVRLDRAVLRSPEDAASIHVLRVLLAVVGGTPQLPDTARTRGLAERLAKGSARMTISRCLVAARSDGVWICRETRGLPPPHPARDGEIWDGRYCISAGPAAVDCLIAPAGSAGAGLAGDLPRSFVRTALAGLPVFVRPDAIAAKNAPHPYPFRGEPLVSPLLRTPVKDGEREPPTSTPPSPREAGLSHMAAGWNVGDCVPPPLTPPRKGEGDFATALPVRFGDDWRSTRPQAGSPPPCGEGLGVGVASYAIALPREGRGEGEGQRDVSGCDRTELLKGWTATPVLAPWSRFLPGFDLELARAVAALLGAPPIPEAPWRGHIVTRA